MPACVICSIVSGDATSHSIFEDDNFIVFLDIKPLFAGHCLLASKKHFETLYDLPKKLIEPYFSLLQRIGKAIEISMQSKGSFIAINNIVSQSIPHLHTHIVPRNPQDGLKGFFWPRTSYTDEEEMKTIQVKIKQAIL